MSPFVLRGATSEERSSLARLIQPARKRLGMKQEDLAQASGISRTSVVNMESGKVTPQEEQLRKVFSVLGIPTEDDFNAEIRGQLAVIGGMLQAFPDRERDVAVELVIETLGARLRVVSATPDLPAEGVGVSAEHDQPSNVVRGPQAWHDGIDDAGTAEVPLRHAADTGEHAVDGITAVDEDPDPAPEDD